MLQKKLAKVKIKMNRNLSLIAKETHHMQKQTLQDRKLRTRTLIQAGGLLSLSGLLEQCDISEGEDLQNDLDGYEKGATLLGILIEASEMILHTNDKQIMDMYKEIGTKKFKQTGAKYIQNHNKKI
jgi:hypothetical protein